MTMTKTVRILANSRTVEIPREIPAGEVIIAFTPVSAKNHADQEINKPEQSISAALRRAQGAWKNNPWTNHLEDVNTMRNEWDQRK